MVSSSVILLKKELITQGLVLLQSSTDLLSYNFTDYSALIKTKKRRVFTMLMPLFIFSTSYGENQNHKPVEKGEDPKGLRQTSQ